MIRTKSSSKGSTSGKARIFLVDDHAMVRRGFRVLLGLEADLALCGEAEGASEAFSKVSRLQPELAVVDLSLKEGDGLQLIQRLRRSSPRLKILVFSLHDESSYVRAAYQAGADGFVAKDEGAEKAVQTIRKLLRGATAEKPLQPVGKFLEPS